MISSSDILHARILIVDDREANVRLLDGILSHAGYSCIASTMDPREVCELHRKNRYDLILLDLLMPGMDGFQVMEGLKQIEVDGYLPVLVITAQPGHMLRALEAGAKDFISTADVDQRVARPSRLWGRWRAVRRSRGGRGHRRAQRGPADGAHQRHPRSRAPRDRTIDVESEEGSGSTFRFRVGMSPGAGVMRT